jgi:Leucine-rich repeat (LRR) protein
MENLKKELLNYKERKLSAFPQEILKHKEVRILNLIGNQISQIPEWIGELTGLEVLYLDHNLISDFSPLTNLHALEVLHLNHNQIASLPKEIIQLKKLKRLYLNSNLLQELPEELFELENLYQLLLANNQLKSIPENLGKANKLETLNLFNNELEEIPNSVCHLEKLTYLQLSCNNLRMLPENMHGLCELESLDCFSNQLEEIESSLSKLNKLTNLNVGDNIIERMEHIPDSILKLSMYANPINFIAPEILNKFMNDLSERDAYLFMDKDQVELLNIEKEKFGKKVRTINLETGEIEAANYKHIPMELHEKFEIKSFGEIMASLKEKHKK